ncbi:MAG: hypothetical protein AAF677_13980 [Pseudomonadota bacterium]
MRLTMLLPVAATALLLAACAAPPETAAPEPAVSEPPAIASLDPALDPVFQPGVDPAVRAASLPDNLWTTRLGGGTLEAVVSNGSANVGFSCPSPQTLAMRFAPDGPALDAVEVMLASRGVRVGFAAAPDSNGNLRATLPTNGLLSPVLAGIRAGAPLEVSLAGRPAALFGANGAPDALSSAFAAGGCPRS